eukprot:scaffold223362_cov23-Tisochrysis_lutea.AAC.1
MAVLQVHHDPNGRPTVEILDSDEEEQQAAVERRRAGACKRPAAAAAVAVADAAAFLEEEDQLVEGAQVHHHKGLGMRVGMGGSGGATGGTSANGVGVGKRLQQQDMAGRNGSRGGSGNDAMGDAHVSGLCDHDAHDGDGDEGLWDYGED